MKTYFTPYEHVSYVQKLLVMNLKCVPHVVTLNEA